MALPLGFSWSVSVFLGTLHLFGPRSMGQDLVAYEVPGVQSELLEGDQENQGEQKSFGYHYETQNRRDPFLPLVFPTQKALISGQPNKPLGGTESHWILLGVISDGEKYYATIQNPEGKLYIVTLGSVLRKEGIRVIKISENQLEFEYLNEGKDSHQTKKSRRLKLGF